MEPQRIAPGHSQSKKQAGPVGAVRKSTKADIPSGHPEMSVAEQLQALKVTARNCLLSDDRMAIHTFLDAGYDLVASWGAKGRLKRSLYQALDTLEAPIRLRLGEPYSIVIYCTVPGLDDKTRSKWARVLRYAAENKRPDESVSQFIKRLGGMNACAAQYAAGG
jgi:hypothetical protein